MKTFSFITYSLVTSVILPTTAIAHPHDSLWFVASEAPAGEVAAEEAHEDPAGEVSVKVVHKTVVNETPDENAGETLKKKMPAMQQSDPKPLKAERARLIREIGPLSKVTDVKKLELRDGLAWLPDAKDPYSGWVSKTWEIRHKHSEQDWHTHNKFTDLGKFEAGVPTMYGSMDENDTLQFVREFAAKDSQQSETWVADFLTYLMTGKSTIIVMPGKAGHLPDATRLMGWHDNGAPEYLSHYSKGKLHGLASQWDSSGRLREQAQYALGEKNGKYTDYYSNDGSKRLEQHWDQGKLVSATVWKRDGEKCNETKVVAGTGVLVLPMFTRMGETEHAKMITVHYLDGVKHGREIRYYPVVPGEPNQPIWAVTTYRNGKRHGTEVTYDFNGKLNNVSYFKDDKRHGTHVWGDMEIITPWVDGEIHGNKIEFQDDGSRKESTYVNSNFVKMIHYNRDGSIREEKDANADWYEGTRPGIEEAHDAPAGEVVLPPAEADAPAGEVPVPAVQQR